MSLNRVSWKVCQCWSLLCDTGVALSYEYCKTRAYSNLRHTKLKVKWNRTGEFTLTCIHNTVHLTYFSDVKYLYTVLSNDLKCADITKGYFMYIQNNSRYSLYKYIVLYYVGGKCMSGLYIYSFFFISLLFTVKYFL